MNQEGIKTGKSEEGKRIRGGLNSTSKKDILDVPFSNTEWDYWNVANVVAVIRYTSSVPMDFMDTNKAC